jgi:hypothetical protein
MPRGQEGRAKAEAAALEGTLSSPNTQECREIFKAALGTDWDKVRR